MASGLTHRGVALAALGAVWLAAGSLWGRPDVTLVGAMLCVALVFWRVLTFGHMTGAVELTWSFTQSRKLRVGDPFVIQLRARVGHTWGVSRIHLRFGPCDGLSVQPIVLAAQRGAEVEAEVPGMALAVGQWRIGELALGVEDELGLLVQQARASAVRVVDVLPRAYPMHCVDAFAGFAQASRAQQVASGFELREIRPWAAGDPFRHVAWKATARTGKLMVRQFEDEGKRSQHFALDVGVDMQEGSIGAQPLDVAIDVVWSWVSSSLGAGSPTGLSLVDGQRLVHIEPGLRHEAKMLRALVGIERGSTQIVAPRLRRAAGLRALFTRTLAWRKPHHVAVVWGDIDVDIGDDLLRLCRLAAQRHHVTWIVKTADPSSQRLLERLGMMVRVVPFTPSDLLRAVAAYEMRRRAA